MVTSELLQLEWVQDAHKQLDIREIRLAGIRVGGPVHADKWWGPSVLSRILEYAISS